MTDLETSKGASLILGANIVFAQYLNNGFSEAYLTAAERATGKSKQEWLKKARQTCREALKATKKNWVILPETLMFQGRYEWLRGKSGAALKWWQQGLGKAQEINDPYFEGMIHLEIGQRTGDRAHLQRAASILEDIGSLFYLEMTREALANLGEDG